jgi:AraC-like DNA-binding protein
MVMQVHFSTDHIAPRDRVRFWCDYFAKQAHSITPGEIPDPAAFRAEARGTAAGEFALLEIYSGLDRVQRTAADIAKDLAKDKTEAFFVRRFRAPVIWKAASRSTPVDLVHEPGDFCVSASEWQFDAEWKGPASFDMLVIPRAALSPIITGGRLECPFRLPGTSPLGSLLGAAIDAAKAQAPLLPDELGEAVLRNLCGLVALTCNASNEGNNRGRDSQHAARLAAVKRYVDLQLADPTLTPASAAAALGISARQLHRLFEQNNMSFAKYVSRERLLRCRDAIAGATGTGRSVVDIAFGWGFNSMATFYRAFVGEFGGPPAMLRAAPEGRMTGLGATGEDTL